MSLRTIDSFNTKQDEDDIYRDSDLPAPLAQEELVDLDSLDESGESGDEETSADSRRRSSPRNLAPLLKLLPLGISTVTLLYLFHLGGQVASIRKGHNQVVVQTVNGRSIIAEPVDNYVRTPATVEQTVKQWTDLTFNWVQKLPNGEIDQGKRIGAKVFPTRLVQASTLMTPDLQQVWHQVFQERDDYLPTNFLGSKATRVYFPKMQTTPRPPVDPRTGKAIENRYEVEVYGDWVEYSSETPQGKLIDHLAFVVRLRPVVKTEPPLSEDADSLQRAAYELRANGLEIYDIQRIEYAR